ncbi:FtsW/RodA/SpoVE family cell cycle protein [Thiocapsa imhoffii]|nr:FtsW/RodA/SpoVE family cell cycle protein [Thiocapsa imhoffii]
MIWSTMIQRGIPLGIGDLLVFGGYAVALISIHLIFVLGRFQGDQILVIAVNFLCGIGMLVQYRLGSFDTQGISRPLLLYPLSLICMALLTLMVRQGRYQLLMSGMWPWFWGLFSIMVLVLLLLFGQRFRGGVYAIGLMTPSEVLKFTCGLFTASLIARYAKTLGDWRLLKTHLFSPWLIGFIGIWCLLVLLLIMLSDVGLLLILGLSLVITLYVGTWHLGYVLIAVISSGALLTLILSLFPHAVRRIDSWLDPFRDPTGGSWQVLQGLSGLYSGGLWGEGFGLGAPHFTPIASSDFVYTVIGEELGFAGTLLLLAIYALLLNRILQIASRTTSDPGRLLVVALFSTLTTQVVLNVAGVTGLIPLTGLPLPFISLGGSSLIVTLGLMAFILAISEDNGARRHVTKKTKRLHKK